MPLLPQSTADLVAQDGLPRVVTADDSSQHVLYLDGLVRSMTAAEWLATRGPLPADPTPAQVAAAIAARQAAEQQAQADAQASRQALRAKLQSAVGVQMDDWTPSQMKALLAYLVRREGGLTNDLKIKPLNEWER